MDSLTPAETGRTLARIEEDVREIRSDLKASESAFVRRDEYRVKTESLDREIALIRSEIKTGLAKIETAMIANRATWWQAASPIISIVSVAIVLVTLIART